MDSDDQGPKGLDCSSAGGAENLKTLRQVDINKLATDPEERKLWEERSIAQQLASEIPEQQGKLEEAQDEARKAGMPASVYDPQ